MTTPNTVKKKSIKTWLVTFADLSLVMLVVFILLYAEASAKNEEKEATIVELNEKLGMMVEKTEVLPVSKDIPTPPSLDPELTFKTKEVIQRESRIQDILRFVDKYAQEAQLESELIAEQVDDGVRLTLPERLLFSSGKSELLEESKQFLDELAPLFQGLPNLIEVEGHTDSVPIMNSNFETNWELSASRRTRVIRYFVEEHNLNPVQFFATGHGEFRPMATNETDEGKRKNRRVVIFIHEKTT